MLSFEVMRDGEYHRDTPHRRKNDRRLANCLAANFGFDFAAGTAAVAVSTFVVVVVVVVATHGRTWIKR
jgi:hypothetical protein